MNKELRLLKESVPDLFNYIGMEDMDMLMNEVHSKSKDLLMALSNLIATFNTAIKRAEKKEGNGKVPMQAMRIVSSIQAQIIYDVLRPVKNESLRHDILKCVNIIRIQEDE